MVISLSDTFYDRFTQKTLLFFLENGWDNQYGGLFEILKSNGESEDIPFRRVMVHARQLFVFSRWAKLTGNNNFIVKADKISILRFRRRKHSMRKSGHRAKHSQVEIKNIKLESK